MKSNNLPKIFILDVDGVFTDGSFMYTVNGKVAKKFGPEDNDALSILKDKLEIIAVTGDKNGYEITKRRIETDMGISLFLVSTYQRIEWIKERYNSKDVIYMGDGIFDPLVFREVAYSIAPANAFFKTKPYANFVTNSKGGEGAVAEACMHILEKFYKPFDIYNHQFSQKTGAWLKKKTSK